MESTDAVPLKNSVVCSRNCRLSYPRSHSYGRTRDPTRCDPTRPQLPTSKRISTAERIFETAGITNCVLSNESYTPLNARRAEPCKRTARGRLECAHEPSQGRVNERRCSLSMSKPLSREKGRDSVFETRCEGTSPNKNSEDVDSTDRREKHRKRRSTI